MCRISGFSALTIETILLLFSVSPFLSSIDTFTHEKTFLEKKNLHIFKFSDII